MHCQSEHWAYLVSGDLWKPQGAWCGEGLARWGSVLSYERRPQSSCHFRHFGHFLRNFSDFSRLDCFGIVFAQNATPWIITQPFKILNDSNFPRECRVEGGCCQLTACQDRQSKPVIRKPAGDAPARCGTLQAYFKSNKVTPEYQTVQTWKTSIRLSTSCPTFRAFYEYLLYCHEYTILVITNKFCSEYS